VNPGAAPDALVEAEDLAVDFSVAARTWREHGARVRAVDGVSLTVARGETLALVGESGCGKTTTGRALLGMYRPARGVVRFDGHDVSTMGRSKVRGLRRRASMIFQDPYSSLNPRMKVGDIVAEPLRAQGIGDRGGRRDRVGELLDLVGLPRDAAGRFPHAFSGGQRQRIGIARALAVEPEFVVADEPVSALDVSIQADVVNLLRDIQRELGLTILFIAHDLAVVRHAADRVAVMYLGKIAEIGSRDEIFEDPKHPYTRSLMSAVPIPDPVRERERPRILLQGEVPSPVDPPAGCRFHTRCPFTMPICRTEEPALEPVSARVRAACHLLRPAEAEPDREVVA
jgi:oligopeptide/dipeptide ABC transporter ATP-binding protein